MLFLIQIVTRLLFLILKLKVNEVKSQKVLISFVFFLWTFFLIPLWRLLRRGSPLPIPNREVKPASADGTWTKSWESMSMPILKVKKPYRNVGLFAFIAITKKAITIYCDGFFVLLIRKHFKHYASAYLILDKVYISISYSITFAGNGIGHKT